jgi:hypothetical protein
MPNTFNAFPECSGSFTATPFSGTGGVDNNSNTTQYYKTLEFTDTDGGKGMIMNQYINVAIKTYYNGDTKQWVDAEGYIMAIKTATSDKDTASYLLAPSATDNTPQLTNVQSQAQKDTIFLKKAHAEYCFYRMYYHGFLDGFLKAVNASDDTNAQNYLDVLMELNVKLNAFVSLVNHITNMRAKLLDARSATFAEFNNTINNTFILAPSAAEAAQLDSKKTILDTRKEMIRYTKEKNNSVTNHISLWAALNIVAIGVIFTLYRKM